LFYEIKQIHAVVLNDKCIYFYLGTQADIHIILSLALILTSISLKVDAQSVGISTGVIAPDASSMLEVQAANLGILIPRVALTATNVAGPIVLPAASLLVYNTATAGVIPNNVVPGYYYNSNTAAAPIWKRFATGNGDAWTTLGNAWTNAATNFIGTTDNIDWVVKTNNIERIRVLGGGRVGINTATPSYLLTLGGINGVFAVDNQAMFVAKNSIGTYEGYFWPRFSDNIMYLNYGSAGFNIRNNASTSTMFMTNNRDVLVNSTVFIAPAIVGDKLNTFITAATNNWAFNGINTSTAGGCVYADNTNTGNGYNAMEAITNGTYSGLMGLHIVNTGAGRGVTATTNSTNNSAFGIYAQNPAADAAGKYAGYFSGRVFSTGNYYILSDERLKENISPLTNGLDKILKLQAVEYDYKKEYSEFVSSSERKVGFLAQEVEKIFPGSSIISDITLQSSNGNVKGKSLNNSKTMEAKSVAYSGFIPYLVEAIKEQQKLIEQMQKEIDQLKLDKAK
jgi:hypothetical protein